MGRVAVKIRTAGDHAVQLPGHRQIRRHRTCVVIGVIHLDGIEAGAAQRSNSIVDEGPAGMGERDQSAGAMASTNAIVCWVLSK